MGKTEKKMLPATSVYVIWMLAKPQISYLLRIAYVFNTPVLLAMNKVTAVSFVKDTLTTFQSPLSYKES